MAIITVKGQQFHIPDKGSSCALWQSYFDQLLKSTGRSMAQTIWLVTWKENGSTSCTLNAGFNQWLKKNDIDVSNAATRSIADISKIGGNVLGAGKNFTKAVSLAIPVLLGASVIVIIMLLINTVKNKDASDLLAFTPVGRAAQLSSGLKMISNR